MSEIVGGVSDLGWVAAKAALLFSLAVIGFRLGERRTLAQLAPFDFAVAVAVGAIIGRTSTSSSTSFASGAVALVTLLIAHRVVSLLRRHGPLRQLLDQPPRVLVAHGQVRHNALARAGLTVEDVYGLLRERHVTRLDDVAYLLYENRGAVTLARSGDDIGPIVRAGLDSAGYREGTRRLS